MGTIWKVNGRVIVGIVSFIISAKMQPSSSPFTAIIIGNLPSI